MLMPLLQTKLYVPSSRPHLVQRDHLIARLLVDGARRLTLVSAPAGFGKTTLVSAWIAQRAQPVAWLSLDDDDNDPIRFLTYLIAALQTHQENVGTIPLGLLAAPQAPLKTILTLLLNDLGKLSTPLALILDDYHLIIAPTVHEAIVFFIDHLPPQMCMVIITRIDPVLPLARWRVRNQLIEVRADDLRFTSTEATVFLNDIMGLTLSIAEIMALEARTEGWIAGLQLAALSLQGRTDVAAFIQAFSGSHRHVLSYLVEEVFNRRPEGTLDFLLQTSILDQMSAALCDAVTERGDSRSLLEKLEQANLFIIPLDDVGIWFRYHHLFAEVLRLRLQQTQPELIPQLHQRASVWYANNGQIEQAVSHALAIPDAEQAAALVESVALVTLFQQSEVVMVLRLMERLPVTVIYRRPELILAYGLTLALAGRFDAVATLLQHAAPAINKSDLPGDVAGGLAVLHSTIARFRGDMDRSLELAHQALSQLPANAFALRATAALNVGSVSFERGEHMAAHQAMADAVAYGAGGGAEYVVQVALATIATDQARRGLLTQAKATCDQALTRVAYWDGKHLPSSGLAHVSRGEVYYERNELLRATQALTRGIQLLQGTTEMTMLMRGYIALARCQWANGEEINALATLQQGEEWLEQTQFNAPRSRMWLAAQRARFHLSQGALDPASRWEHETVTLGEGPLAYLQQLTRVRVWLAQYASDPKTNRLSEATYLLNSLLTTAEARGWDSHLIEIMMLRGLLAEAQGNHPASRTALTHAFVLSEPQGYLRLFVDEGEAGYSLISDFRLWIEREAQIKNQAELSSYASKLLKLFPTNRQPAAQKVSVAQASSQTLVEALSVRELEVLRLIATGLSNTQIADRLIVSTGTVKTHINHIFGKLAVENRTSAVARARELGLLTS